MCHYDNRLRPLSPHRVDSGGSDVCLGGRARGGHRTHTVEVDSGDDVGGEYVPDEFFRVRLEFVVGTVRELSSGWMENGGGAKPEDSGMLEPLLVVVLVLELVVESEHDSWVLGDRGDGLGVRGERGECGAEEQEGRGVLCGEDWVTGGTVICGERGVFCGEAHGLLAAEEEGDSGGMKGHTMSDTLLRLAALRGDRAAIGSISSSSLRISDKEHVRRGEGVGVLGD